MIKITDLNKTYLPENFNRPNYCYLRAAYHAGHSTDGTWYKGAAEAHLQAYYEAKAEALRASLPTKP